MSEVAELFAHVECSIILYRSFFCIFFLHWIERWGTFMSQPFMNLGESKWILWLKRRPCDTQGIHGFWLQTRKTAAVLILIAVTQVAIRDISVLEDFLQSFSRLTVFEW